MHVVVVQHYVAAVVEEEGARPQPEEAVVEGSWCLLNGGGGTWHEGKDPKVVEGHSLVLEFGLSWIYSTRKTTSTARGPKSEGGRPTD